MGRTYTSIKVDRLKIIERLEKRIEEIKSTRDKEFKKKLANEIVSAKKTLKTAEDRLKKLEGYKTPEDAKNEYWVRSNDHELEKQVSLLKLSEQEELLISPTSNLYSYL